MVKIDNGKKLSIIIPYYETYDLTQKLLIQLVTQLRSSDVEIILIDDGCYELRFDRFVEKLKIYGFACANFIKIIHKKNGGVSSARNLGIELAQGKYIAFIDSDDMVMSNYIEDLIKIIDERDEDVIYFNWLDINTNEVVRHPSNPAVWKAMYRNNDLPKFDETLKTREDYFFNQELDSKNLSKYYYDKVLYVYNSNRKNSLSWKDAHE